MKSLSINNTLQVAGRFPHDGRLIRSFQGFKPTVPTSWFIEETGTVIGGVVLGDHDRV
ncbi:MAG TPA: hypothetical protein VGQ08_20080 [Nitrospiraceae bacterium]|nr:hypothetical protein [Nitrospiraceae bacterium]